MDDEASTFLTSGAAMNPTTSRILGSTPFKA